MKIEQLLEKRNSTKIVLCMLNTNINGIKYDNVLFRAECECDCGNHDDCNCFDVCNCNCERDDCLSIT